MTSADIPNAISSPESADGASRYVWQDGPTIGLYGPDPARASLSARQAKERGLLTSGTYGLPGTGSSRSAALTSSLASRLKQRLSTIGSTLFTLTWKELVTPSARRVSLLRASALRTAWGEAFARNASDAFPLIRGAANRVGRLRAYGNAIVPQVAAEVIGAYMELGR